MPPQCGAYGGINSHSNDLISNSEPILSLKPSTSSIKVLLAFVKLDPLSLQNFFAPGLLAANLTMAFIAVLASIEGMHSAWTALKEKQVNMRTRHLWRAFDPLCLQSQGPITSTPVISKGFVCLTLSSGKGAICWHIAFFLLIWHSGHLWIRDFTSVSPPRIQYFCLIWHKTWTGPPCFSLMCWCLTSSFTFSSFFGRIAGIFASSSRGAWISLLPTLINPSVWMKGFLSFRPFSCHSFCLGDLFLSTSNLAFQT